MNKCYICNEEVVLETYLLANDTIVCTIVCTGCSLETGCFDTKEELLAYWNNAHLLVKTEYIIEKLVSWIHNKGYDLEEEGINEMVKEYI